MSASFNRRSRDNSKKEGSCVAGGGIANQRSMSIKAGFVRVIGLWRGGSGDDGLFFDTRGFMAQGRRKAKSSVVEGKRILITARCDEGLKPKLS